MNRHSGKISKTGPYKTALNKFTNTTPDLLLCPECQVKKLEEDPILLKDYIKSINYINSCHSIINAIIKTKNPESSIFMPDFPNFLNILSVLKQTKIVHELDNIESLEEIYSKLETTPDVNLETEPESENLKTDSPNPKNQSTNLQTEPPNSESESLIPRTEYSSARIKYPSPQTESPSPEPNYTTDSDIEPDKFSVVKQKLQDFSSEEEKTVKSAERKSKISNIPRPVSKEKKSRSVSPDQEVPQNHSSKRLSQTSLPKMVSRSKHSCHEARRGSHAGKKSQSDVQETTYQRSTSKMMFNKALHKKESKVKAEIKPTQEKCDEMAISQQDLDKFAKELLGSCSDTVSSPRTTSTFSRSPSPKIRKTHFSKITYKTKSEHCMKIVPKMKVKIPGVKYKSCKKRPSTVGEVDETQRSPRKEQPKLQQTSSLKKSHLSSSLCENAPSPTRLSEDAKTKKRVLINCEETPPVVEDYRKSKSQPSMIQQEQWDMTNEEFITEEFTNTQKIVNYDESDIEPDDHQEMNLLAIKNSFIMKKRITLPRASVKQQEAQYVVKQKPIDFFTKCRTNANSDSEIYSDKDLKELPSESDIDDDVFEREVLVVDKPELPLGTKGARLPKSVLSNIGILTNTGKMKPEKLKELERLKSTLAKDKHNSSFRQPRNREEEEEYDEVIQMRTTRFVRNSSHSSDIKTDDDDPELEIRTHHLDLSVGNGYKCHY